MITENSQLRGIIAMGFNAIDESLRDLQKAKTISDSKESYESVDKADCVSILIGRVIDRLEEIVNATMAIKRSPIAGDDNDTE